MSDLIKVTGLWKKNGKDGAFYSGKIGIGANALVFKNRYCRDENDPDLFLYIGPAPETRDWGRANPPVEGKREKFPDEEIPDSDNPI